ncbi:cytochrome P450 [Streptomyces diastatochromogenes]|uniref:cytochrome P450 n=1 Tax=Streptomyces diastatochromogenes TaxID=42236 RepID=UPI00368A4121
MTVAEAAAAAGCPAHLGDAFGNMPYPVYKELQEAGPVSPVILRDGSEAFLITRYDDVRACYGDLRLSSSLDDAPKPRGAGSLAAPPVGGLVLRRDEVSGHMMINQDPPNHTRLRKLVVPSFSAKRVNAMEPHILRIAKELLDGIDGSTGPVELIEAYAKPLPVMVQSQLLGVSPDKHDAFTHGMDELTGGKNVEAAQRGLDLIKELLAEQIERKRLQPEEDLLTTLVQVAEEEGRIEEIELLAAAIQVMLAGYFGIQSMIGNCVYWLLKFPEKKAELLADPSLMPAAMDEIFRFDGPQQPGSNRYATEDIEVGGGVIPKGSLVILSVSAANRDPRKFPDPDVLDFERENAAEHIAFGSGIHYCVGSRLALKVVGLATLALLQAFPQMRLAMPEEELDWELRTPFRGLSSLPVLLQ